MNIREKFQNSIYMAKKSISKHSPEILAGLGVSSMILSTIFAIKATPKAISILDNYKKENKLDKIDYKQTLKLVWREYVPTIGLGVTGSVCIISGCAINSKRSAALTAAYALSEKALLTYKDKVIETIGEKKEKELVEMINQDSIDKQPPQTSQVIITSKGNTLIMDSISGRYFRSDLDTIRKIQNELNREMTYQNYISLNQLYNALGLAGVKDGDLIGWNIDNGLIDLSFGTCLADNDEPCICIDYDRLPKANFDR